MKIIIEIPNYEFDNDVKDKFQDYFERVKADIADGTLCGNYELETTDMFLASFKRLQVLPDNATNGDMVEKIFGKDVYCTLIRMMYSSCCEKLKNWWNAPYKKESE